MAKKLFRFFELIAYVMGTIGGIGYCCYSHAYVIAVAVALLAVMAWPEFLYAARKLVED